MVMLVAAYASWAITAAHGGTALGHDGSSPSQGAAWGPTFLGAVLAIWGAESRRWWLLVIGFSVGFLWRGVGLYTLLLLPGWPALVGIGELGYLAAAFLIRRDGPG